MRQVGAACIGDGIRSLMPTTRVKARGHASKSKNAPHQAESELHLFFGHEKWVQFKV